MDSATSHSIPVHEVRSTPTFKAYLFVAAVEELHAPLRLEIDCVNDMEASLMALSLVSRKLGVEVWSDGALIYRAPPIGEHEQSPDTPQTVRIQEHGDAVELSSTTVNGNFRTRLINT
jgi:hypothetical protein